MFNISRLGLCIVKESIPLSSKLCLEELAFCCSEVEVGNLNRKNDVIVQSGCTVMLEILSICSDSRFKK